MVGGNLINVRRTKKRSSFDKGLLVFAFILTFLGIVLVADVSAPQALEVFSDSLYFAKQQALWAVIGLIGMLVASRVHYLVWRRLALVIFIMSIVLLIIVVLPGFGVTALGARRWLLFGSISFQPSEFAKFSLALFMAFILDQKRPLWHCLFILALVGGLVMLEPDLGTTMILLTIGLAQIFVSGVSLFSFGLIILGGAVLGFILIVISSYRRQRFMTFLQNSQNPLDSSYHIRQILIALGSGGILGAGLGQSRQKYLFLPETATDSVFAIIAEEVGFIGAALIIILFAIFIYKVFQVCLRSPDRFSSLLATGIAMWLGGQAMLNIGSMVALVPLTGIPLPFFSYGGSSLVMVLLGVGILLNISKYRKITRR
jgi:cell division protein FtsW